MTKIADAIENWMVQSGLVDQLSILVTNTTLLRSTVMAAASYAVAHGIAKGNPSEAVVSAIVVVLTGSLNQFISYLRNKYATQVQQSLPGCKVDKFIGPETVQAVQVSVASSSSSSASASA